MDDKLYDHYKETCELQRNSIKDRNKFFILTCVLAGALYAVAVSPDNFMSMITSFLLKRYEVDLTVSVNGVQSFVWINLLYCTMRYYQSNCNIEKQYMYIDTCEKLMSQQAVQVSREGENYEANYPIVLTIIDRFYKYLFPLLLLAIASYKEVSEIINYFLHHIDVGIMNLALHAICYLAIAILCVAYLVYMRQIVKRWK